MVLASIRRLLTSLLVGGSLAVLVSSCASDRIARPLAPPDLTRPPDRLTTARLHSLADPALCRAVLQQARIPHTPVPPLQAGQCGYTNALRLNPRGPDSIAFRPDSPVMTCQLAAAAHLWLRDVVQPAAQTHLGSRVVAIDHFGTYACRNIYGSQSGSLSEHARANALDVAGFRLANGRQITLLRHWQGTPQERAFLREVRDGGCRLFGTTLSPDYNQAHADHFHFDMARRGAGLFGGFCR